MSLYEYTVLIGQGTVTWHGPVDTVDEAIQWAKSLAQETAAAWMYLGYGPQIAVRDADTLHIVHEEQL